MTNHHDERRPAAGWGWLLWPLGGLLVAAAFWCLGLVAGVLASVAVRGGLEALRVPPPAASARRWRSARTPHRAAAPRR